MNPIEKYRKKNLLQKLKENNNRKKTFHYIEDSKKIAFIINSDNDKLINQYSNFIVDLKKQNKIIKELFVTGRKIKKGEVLPENTITISDKSYLKSAYANEFISEHYDILFTVFEKMEYKIQHISALISADLKVSPNYTDFNSADITFLVEDKDFNEYFKAINQYLSNKNK